METLGKISLTKAKCTGLTIDAPVAFLAENEAKEGADFQMEAYTGAVVDRWWGKLAIEISGIKAPQRMPILRDHIPRDIVGYSLKSWSDDSFWVTGRYSKATETAKEVQALADEGFPWQASIRVEAMEIVEIKSGAVKNVNGIEVMGPAEIWTKSKVSETSFVPMGADGDTTVTRFSKFEETARGANKTQEKEGIEMFTIEQLEREAPELLAKIRQDAVGSVDETALKKDGADAERARLLGLAEVQFGKEPADAFKKVVETGVTVEQFTAIRGTVPPGGNDTLANHKKQILEALKNSGPKNPGAGGGDNENEKDFLSLVEEHQTVNKCGKVAAMQAVMRKHPEAHRAYIESVN